MYFPCRRHAAGMSQGRFFCHAGARRWGDSDLNCFHRYSKGAFPLNDKLIVFIDIVRGGFPPK